MTISDVLVRVEVVEGRTWTTIARPPQPRRHSAGLPRHELPLALVTFNVGVELGQLGFIALVLALENSFRALEVSWPRWVQELPGYTVGSLGAYWTVQRLALLLAAR